MASPGLDDIEEVFRPDGLLAESLDGFGWRAQQQAMAARVAQSLDGGTLICEAGTGTGKTYAYLVPAMLSGRKVIVATGTRNLQDQLFHRDIPVIRRALGLPLRVALLKGRANYLCRHRLDRAVAHPEALRPEVRRDLALVRDWASVPGDGDIARVAIPEGAPVWPAVTSTSDNCLGQACADWQRCHFVAARRRAQEADLVVINHHLLCADMVLREEGFGEVLPGADAIVVDEAHQLPDVAAQFFGHSLSSRQLREFVRDLLETQQREAGDVPQLKQVAEALGALVPNIRRALGHEEQRRGAWSELDGNRALMDLLEQLLDLLAETEAQLGEVSERAKPLEQCHARAAAFGRRLTELLDEDDDTRVRWFELRGAGFMLHRTPLDVAAVFRAYQSAQHASWVFTSATLAVGDSFAHFAAQIGAEDADTARWDSPFDYRRQALLYLPKGLPDPGAGDYDETLCRTALQVIAASRGRTFCLFTSHRALRFASDYLGGRMAYPLLVQGEAPRAELIERFRRLGDGVLLGTSSFWEGVDVRGEALSCVIIDRLPFASPSDPLLQGRIDLLRRRGGNPFRDLQLPAAVIALKQGAGRLIRDRKDRGVLVLCDPRLCSRTYGRVFLDSLPRMSATTDLPVVERFLSPVPAPER